VAEPERARFRWAGWASPVRRRRAITGLAACGATLVAAGVFSALLPPPPPAGDYTKGFAPHWLTAIGAASGLVIALLVLVRPRLGGARAVAAALAWAACAILLWSAAGVVFDILRIAAVIGIPGLPPFVDWPGFAIRATALVGTVTVALLALSLGEHWTQRLGSSRLAGWCGYAAAALSLPYPVLKIYWMLGGTVGWRASFERHAAVGETAMLIAMTALSLALVRPWGRIFPRSLLLLAGWIAAVALLSTGALVAFGTLAEILGIVRGPAGFDLGAWIIYLAYGDWLLLGMTLAVATWVYQQRTRSPRRST